MRPRQGLDALLALAGGGLLASMIKINGLLAQRTSALHASWAAHGVGALTALVLAAAVARGRAQPSAQTPPWWSRLGGLPGGCAVVLASMTVNGALGLSRSLAFIMTGQIVFGLLCDGLGLLGLPKRHLSARDFAAVAAVVGGSSLMLGSR